jgi:hypothetical protein
MAISFQEKCFFFLLQIKNKRWNKMLEVISDNIQAEGIYTNSHKRES